ncbi:hypothetical protein [Providencia rettgeri]|uniref:hypothetical protein n=1 Tax=Providencia rettgeri TaxID=587 RepID=UPI002551ECE1|nr:hypothetical protein [Providencia rettgeri]MDK7744773.1 hypothetical protein [Providencia rettgeri]MDK7759703.1 hypothetical protein [Providencia rettgeri]
MCNEKHPLEKLAVMLNKDQREKFIKDVNNRVELKSDLKGEILNGIFFYMNKGLLDIDGVYETLTDVRSELDHALELNEILFKV